MIRLFIAMPLPGEVERRLEDILRDLRAQSRDVKWVVAKNIHLTIKFLGETEEDLAPGISKALDDIAAKHSAIDSVIDTLGGFPNLKRPRVIWVGSAQPVEAAARIAGDVDLAMQAFNFEKETRPFKAHLTMGRVREGRKTDDLARYIERYRLERMPLRLDRLTLFKSTLTPAGSIYDRLHESLLGATRFEG
jgi:2'-5' RNA ligase